MNKHITISCELLVNDPTRPLNFKILLDDDIIFEVITSESKYSFVDTVTCTNDITEHSLKFVLSGKTDKHTVIDEDGSILSSAQVEICDIKFNEVNISDILTHDDTLTTYTHNSNGYSDEIIENFNTSCMGYNGNVNLKFTTPIYTWLIDNMNKGLWGVK